MIAHPAQDNAMMPTAILAQLCDAEVRTAPDLNLIGRRNWHSSPIQTSELCVESEYYRRMLPICNSQTCRHPLAGKVETNQLNRLQAGSL
jgi:hypothetical protein